jgi:hypothetical protein
LIERINQEINEGLDKDINQERKNQSMKGEKQRGKNNGKHR